MIWPIESRSIVFRATIVIWIRTAYGQDCDRFNVSRIPVVEPSSYLDMYYFSCVDGEFFTSVDVWHGNSVDELRWRCSDGEASYYPDDASDYLNYSWVTFDVGITAVEARFLSSLYDDSSDTFVYLGDSYIGGYNLAPYTSTSDGVILEWSGPFGTGDNYTIETWTSNCPSNSYATGATWWNSPLSGSLNGIQLECADVTSTCYPSALENQGDDDATIGDDDATIGTYDNTTGQGCHRFNISRIPAVQPSSNSDIYFFTCADGEFLTSVDVWYSISVDELRWRCSDGDTSYYPDNPPDYANFSWVTFDVGITAIETRFISWAYSGSSDTLVYLGDSYIGGYNVFSSASTSNEAIFGWSGPFGSGDNYTAETWIISCPDNSYATGVTWWKYAFLNGIQLECADVTSTCYPSALENQDGTTGDGVTSTSTDDAVTSTGTNDERGETRSTESNDTSSGTELGIIIATSVGTAVVVVLLAVAIGLCFLRSRRRNLRRAQNTKASQAIDQGNSSALPRPDAAPQIFIPSSPAAREPASRNAPPRYQLPHDAPVDSPPQYVSPGRSEAGYLGTS